MLNVKNKKKIIIPSALLLVVAIAVTGVVFLPKIKYEYKEYSYVSTNRAGTDFNENFEELLAVGGNRLYFNKNAGAVAIVSKNNAVFNSSSYVSAENSLSDIISIVLRDSKGNSYLMNSTDNSITFNTFELTEDNGSKVLTFSMYESDEAVGTGDGVFAKVPVVFSTDNGCFKVSVDMEKVTVPKNFVVEKISILPGLFSESQSDAFYTVPDGSGAEVDLSDQISAEFTLNLPMYGSDVAFTDYTEGANLPVFALTKNNTMITALITDGDALSSLTLERKLLGGNLYNTFTVTSFGEADGRLVKGESYKGVISQTYSVTSDTKNNYNSLSTVVRDNLISRGYLSSDEESSFNDYPFFVTAVMSETGKKNSIYTDFENAGEMVALLKLRGVRSVALRVVGAGDDGLNSGAEKCDTLNDALGGVKGYNDLCTLAAEKNSSVWLDVNVNETPNKKANNSYNMYSDIRAYLNLKSVGVFSDSVKASNNNISSVYKMMNQFENGNICINDISKSLRTDLSPKSTNRQDVLDNFKDKISSLSVGGGLMLSEPAVYLMKDADAVFTVPQKASCDGLPGVTSVPLMQMVLHGSVQYGSEPVNLMADDTAALLKAMETGASPSYVFTYTGSELLNYGPYVTQISKHYSTAKKMLPLMDKKITSHEEIASGVFKITYDYNKTVYVNYNSSFVTVDGLLVSGNSFIII
ncbi:MAG: DUF5696 domain-containing protein [Acutalibacteraceae bacterium]